MRSESCFVDEVPRVLRNWQSAWLQQNRMNHDLDATCLLKFWPDTGAARLPAD